MKIDSSKNFDSNPNIISLLNFCKGLAIVGVVLVHCQGGWFGWQGVHIFIVLSGFGLTYSCLKKEHNIDWKQWYIRRAEKILPAYWLVCIVGFIVTIFVYVFVYKFKLLAIIFRATIELILDILLLRNFHYSTVFGYLNASLWFIPFIVGFYFIFPWIYTQALRERTVKGYLSILLWAVVIEFIYRAIAIYYLDGVPVGYGHGFLEIPSSVSPLNRLENNIFIPFQEVAPFGIFISRIAEFILGMIGAFLLIENQKLFYQILLNFWTTLVGLFIWLLGQALLYIGLWGWVFSDFIIALGLTIVVINLAWICQRQLPVLFAFISRLGYWSYYTFLTHLIWAYVLIYPFLEREAKLIENQNIVSAIAIKYSTIAAMILVTAITNWLLMYFDQSLFSKLLIKQSIARFIKL